METLLDILDDKGEPLVNIKQRGFIVYPHMGETIVFSDGKEGTVMNIKHVIIDNTVRIQVYVVMKNPLSLSVSK